MTTPASPSNPPTPAHADTTAPPVSPDSPLSAAATHPHQPNVAMRLLGSVMQWFDSNSGADKIDLDGPMKVDWMRNVPYFAMHLMCLGVIWVGISPIAVVFAIGLYFLRMFFITGFYHRYFSHRSFQTSRWFQCVMAISGLTAIQRGPLWWAAHHRHHHQHSDQPEDLHSPDQQGFVWSHMLWFTAKRNFPTRYRAVRDLAQYPELCLLDRFEMFVYIAFAAGIFFTGVGLNALFPELGTSGMQLLIWGFFISTVLTYHGTYTINSLAHRFGRQRYRTGDDSRNSFLLALITLGEGWHNNHHHYPVSVRQGFYWWEIDITYYVLKSMAAVGLVWNLQGVPEKYLNAKRLDRPEVPHA